MRMQYQWLLREFLPLKSNDVDSANLYINTSEIEDPASIVKRLKDNDA